MPKNAHINTIIMIIIIFIIIIIKNCKNRRHWGLRPQPQLASSCRPQLPENNFLTVLWQSFRDRYCKNLWKYLFHYPPNDAGWLRSCTT